MGVCVCLPVYQSHHLCSLLSLDIASNHIKVNSVFMFAWCTIFILSECSECC